MTASCDLCFSVYQPSLRKNGQPRQVKGNFCSNSCRVMFMKGRQPGAKRVRGEYSTREMRKRVYQMNNFKVCTSCLIEKDLTNFFNDRKRYWAVCKECHLKKKATSWQEYLQQDEVFNKCYQLILDFQKKRYFLDQIDIMRLIDIWDDIYPNDVVTEKQIDFNKIMLRVYSWFIKERERIIKEEL